MWFRQVLFVLAAVAILATSCASGSESSAPSTAATIATNDDATTDSTSESTADDAPAETESTESGSTETGSTETDATGAGDPGDQDGDSEGRTVNNAYVSPVFDALGIDPDDRQDSQAEFVANAEELVRQCMADAGFEYVPTIPPSSPAFTRLLELNASISPEQFTAEYGYGIATLIEYDFREEGVLAFVELLIGPAPTEARSEGEQAAYELALSGDTLQGLSAEEAQEQALESAFSSEDGSCRSYGYQNADNTLGEKFEGLNEILGEAFDGVREQVDNDERIRQLNSEWQRCMAGHGYSYDNGGNIFTEFNDAADDLRNGFQSSPEALAIFAAAGEAGLSAMNVEDRYDFLDSQGAFQGFAMVPSLQVELDDLIQRELTVAAHDLECSDTEAFFEVRREYEEAFVEEHAAQLQLIAAGEA